MQHTSHLSRYGVVYGRMVQFFVRPEKTNQKAYREPKPAGSQWFKNGKAAKRAAKRFEKPLTNK